MKICIEVELIPEYHESDSTVKLEGLRFPGCSQNVLIFMSTAEQARAQQLLEEAVQDSAIERVERLLERKAMKGDVVRDLRKDERKSA
jgi:hypothetical protein